MYDETGIFVIVFVIKFLTPNSSSPPRYRHYHYYNLFFP